MVAIPLFSSYFIKGPITSLSHSLGLGHSTDPLCGDGV
jgi:hypothetical protein